MLVLFFNKDGTYIDVQECYTVVFCSVTGSYKTIPYMGKTGVIQCHLRFSNFRFNEPNEFLFSLEGRKSG